jgi:hypothetical protein
VRRPGDLGVGNADHAPIQRCSQHLGLHPRRRDPWFEAVSTGSRYSRHPPYQRPPSGYERRNPRTPAAEIATATRLDRTSLSGTPETDNKTWWVFTCSLAACRRYAPGCALRSGVVMLEQFRLAAVNVRPDQRFHAISDPDRFADAAERIASAKVTIRPHPSSHRAWRDARNPSARVNTDARAKPGCAAWQASSR